MMVPAGVVDKMLTELGPLLESGDTLIDGGNSYYIDDINRSEEFKEKGIHYVDCGTSGGVWGMDRGYCMMIGGDEAVKHLDPIFACLAPPVDSAERTPGKTGDPSTAEHGYFHCGPSGAGHFVKMVHNGIEYGIMAAYAEGLAHPRPRQHRQASARKTTPRRPRSVTPSFTMYDLNIPARGRGLETRERDRVVAPRPHGSGPVAKC